VIHALQWLPVLAWAARRAGFTERRRVRLVATATCGTILIGWFALAQTLAGRSRFDVTPVTAAVLAAGAACLVVPTLAIAAAAGRTVPSSR
jgi:tetrahydromethanopterin S-methyltransferase subunit E